MEGFKLEDSGGTPERPGSLVGGNEDASYRARSLGGQARAGAQNGPRRPSARRTWVWRGLLVVSIAVPLLLLAAAAWENYLVVEEQADAGVTNRVGELNEEALATLDTYSSVLTRVEDRTRGLDWPQIEHDYGLHRFLSDIESLPEINDVWVVDETGHVRASGRFFPAQPIDVSDREYFQVQKKRDVGIFIGRPYVGPLIATPEFHVSLRRSSQSNKFAGIIIVSARPDYFSKFYSSVSHQKGFVAMLMRSDGLILARYPTTRKFSAFSWQGKLMRAIAVHPQHGLVEEPSEVDGTSRILGYERVENFPVYVAFGIPEKGVLAAWMGNLINYSLFAVPAAVALFILTLFAARQLREQEIATWRWRTTARRLHREAERRARAEAELRQSQKMDALGQLTGGVAHDFNNLLTVLQGNLEILRASATDQKSRERIDQALATVARGETLTGRLLAFARRQPLKIESFDLNLRLRTMAELLERAIGSGVTLETRLASDLWPAQADSGQLELAVINLAINARDAMEEGGTLTIRTFNRPESVSEESRGDFVGLEISDTGKGMPPEVLARAREPFFTTKSPGRGTGLGLSMVDDFVRRAGGVTTIASEIGFGTTVTIFLPRGRAPDNSAEGAKADLPPDALG